MLNSRGRGIRARVRGTETRGRLQLRSEDGEELM